MIQSFIESSYLFLYVLFHFYYWNLSLNFVWCSFLHFICTPRFFLYWTLIRYWVSCPGTIFVATFPAAVCCLPFEYVMIEIKKMQPDDKGKYPYTGYVDCAVKTLIAGGPLKFYTEFSVYCARIFPCVTVFFFCLCFVLQTTIVTVATFYIAYC